MLNKRKAVFVLALLCILALLSSAYSEVLPSFDSFMGTELPSVSFALGREPEVINNADGSSSYLFRDFTSEDYQLLDRYLTGNRAVFGELKLEGNQAFFSVKVKDEDIQFVYNDADKTLMVTYPKGIRLEKEPGAFSEIGTVLPDISTAFIIYLPNMRSAINYEPSNTYDSENEYIEEYDHFFKKEYTDFSNYLQSFGCSVSGYTKEGEILYISLEYKGISMTFVYDPEEMRAALKYPVGAHLETPTQASATEPEPTEGPSLYSETDCWYVAQDYFMNMSWKNPDSLTIHGYTSLFSDNSYTFVIDYSAQNGFGGYNRAYYYITVNAKTKKVTSAFGT